MGALLAVIACSGLGNETEVSKPDTGGEGPVDAGEVDTAPPPTATLWFRNDTPEHLDGMSWTTVDYWSYDAVGLAPAASKEYTEAPGVGNLMWEGSDSGACWGVNNLRLVAGDYLEYAISDLPGHVLTDDYGNPFCSSGG